MRAISSKRNLLLILNLLYSSMKFNTKCTVSLRRNTFTSIGKPKSPFEHENPNKEM